jgi:hypothetical protein
MGHTPIQTGNSALLCNAFFNLEIILERLMKHIEWSPEQDTHIPIIDKQHHRIVEYINSLYDIRDTHDREEVGRVLQELVDYTLSHFAFDESR